MAVPALCAIVPSAAMAQPPLDEVADIQVGPGFCGGGPLTLARPYSCIEATVACPDINPRRVNLRVTVNAENWEPLCNELVDNRGICPAQMGNHSCFYSTSGHAALSRPGILGVTAVRLFRVQALRLDGELHAVGLTIPHFESSPPDLRSVSMSSGPGSLPSTDPHATKDPTTATAARRPEAAEAPHSGERLESGGVPVRAPRRHQDGADARRQALPGRRDQRA